MFVNRLRNLLLQGKKWQGFFFNYKNRQVAVLVLIRQEKKKKQSTETSKTKTQENYFSLNTVQTRKLLQNKNWSQEIKKLS